MSADYRRAACTCSGGVCKGDSCLFCGAFSDACPQTGAPGPAGQWFRPDIPVHKMFPHLLGCGWGRDVTTPDDTAPCDEPAHQIIVLHQEDGSTQDVRLCLRHVARILDETTPHQFD